MLDFIYGTGWGAFTITMMLFLPFILLALFVLIRRAYFDFRPVRTSQGALSRLEAGWLAVVIAVFVGVNLASITYMPTIATAEAAASGKAMQHVNFEARSWSYEFSQQTIEVGQPVRFSGVSRDTVHGFAVYHPDGRMLFTMMLMPGLTEPTSLVHVFDEPGTYTVRCLEFCGLEHHNMRDELIVVAATNARS